MYFRIVEVEDSIYELDEECVNRKRDERENKNYQINQEREEKK